MKKMSQNSFGSLNKFNFTKIINNNNKNTSIRKYWKPLQQVVVSKIRFLPDPNNIKLLVKNPAKKILISKAKVKHCQSLGGQYISLPFFFSFFYLFVKNF